jgi:hypothetical protein
MKKAPKKATEIITQKTGNAVSLVMAKDVQSVTVEAICNAGSALQLLCLNVLVGNVANAIINAAGERGGITKLFGGKISDADLAAINRLVKAGYFTNDPKLAAEIREKWAAFVNEAKRVRCISLQRLAKIIGMGAKEEKPASLKERLAAWVAANPKSVDTLPRDLFDIFVDASIITE